MMRVIVLDNLSEEGLQLLQANDALHVEVRTGLAGEELRLALAEFDGAICRSGVKITAESLEGNRRLKAIVRAGVGTDNIDKAAATRAGIVVMNTPTGNTVSTAEHTVALMLALSRNVAPAYQSLIEGRWDRKKYMGSQLAGKTLGIVGLGRIGQAVALRAQALEMRTIGFDPYLSKERAQELGIQRFESVDAMLPEIDYLTVHTPLTDETRGLFGEAQLEIVKPGARLINCARGGLYDEAVLVRGLESGKLAGVALDVFEEEPCQQHPLFGMPGVLSTPHLGASTEEAQTQVAVEAVHLLVDYLTNGNIRCAVNVSPIDAATLDALRGYLDVSFRLGLLLAQLDPSGARACRLHYRGQVAEKDTKLLTASFACGLLAHALDTEPNIVNAELLLRERGIELAEEQEPTHGAFSSLVQAELITDRGTTTAGGTLFGHNMPRLVRLDDNQLEAYLDGVLMVFPHQDVPGIIGSVGTTLGNHQVNIAQMSVGRSTRGGESIGILNLDEIPPEAAVAEVRAHPAVRDAIVIQLPAAGELPSWLAAD
ncbi:MAG: phosphoglycerate dehydrogenase [Planctomycetota bacterium]|nr:MAG: phosphoglycerate dehydrogenase [Planctomycetota bacterium]REJ96854.1 MAG: phosphoglycerate dehydrogenase [Planctomycetota bacterium]REK24043.1 MAG: phosphoglycerate dehydrogenase [Planctomycetota bacterium]REK39374.1 MAG: phosphoglycerate dehydrogenase [Planctomycetota bacterium]